MAASGTTSGLRCRGPPQASLRVCWLLVPRTSSSLTTNLAALIGCVLLLAADLVAQSLSIKPPIPSSSARVGLPVGAVLAVFGAPLLIILIRRSIR